MTIRATVCRLQHKHWDPVVEWMKEHYGIEMNVTPDEATFLSVVRQPLKSLFHVCAVSTCSVFGEHAENLNSPRYRLNSPKKLP